MHRSLTLTWQFYRPFLYYHLIFTAFGLFLIVGTADAIFLALPTKLLSYGGMAFYQHYLHPQEYFYYRNAGTSMRRVYALALAADLLAFVTVATVCLLLTK